MLRDGLAGNFRARLTRTLPVVLPDGTKAGLPRILLQYSTDTYPIRNVDADSEDVQNLLRALAESPEHARPPQGARSTRCHVGGTPRPELREVEEHLCSGSLLRVLYGSGHACDGRTLFRRNIGTTPFANIEFGDFSG